MSDHLPECPHTEPDLNPGFLVMCICDRLRACEQRVREDERNECVRAIRARRDALVEQITGGQVQTKSLASAIYEDAMATIRLLTAIGTLRGES